MPLTYYLHVIPVCVCFFFRHQYINLVAMTLMVSMTAMLAFLCLCACASPIGDLKTVDQLWQMILEGVTQLTSGEDTQEEGHFRPGFNLVG